MNLAAEPQFPTKWPFPPAPPASRGVGAGAVAVPPGAAEWPGVAGNTSDPTHSPHAANPVWPYPPRAPTLQAHPGDSIASAAVSVAVFVAVSVPSVSSAAGIRRR